MHPTKAAARRAGALYFLLMIVAIVGEFLLPAFMVTGDAGATARNIAAAEGAYRLGLLVGLVTLVLFIFLVVSLYGLLERVDRSQALLMMLLVGIGVAVALGNLLHKFEPLVLLSGADGLSAFTQPQREALALDALGTHGRGSAVVTVFWGLWPEPPISPPVSPPSACLPTGSRSRAS